MNASGAPQPFAPRTSGRRPSQRHWPGPRGLPVLGSLPQMWRNPLRMFWAASQRYGDIFQFRVGPRPYFFVIHPEGIQRLLVAQQRNYAHWPRDNRNFRALLGHGLLTSEGDIWRRHRTLAQPAFHQRRLAGLLDTVSGATAEVAVRWDHAARTGQPIDIGAEMGRLTLAIVTRALYGQGADDQADFIGQSLSHAIRHIAHELMLPFELPELANRRFLATVQALDRVVYDVIENRQRDPRGHNDLLAMLMDARDETGAGLSAQELRDEVLTFLLAGHETSALGLTWAWYLLAQHPTAEHRLQAEAAQVLGGRAPDYADLARLPFTHSVIQETLRLYPPAGTMARVALAEDEISGWPVPAGAVIFFSPYVTQRLPAHWPEPEVFSPQRFSAEAPALRPRYAYFPFGGGPRQCIGKNFALMEMQTVLALLAQRFRLLPWPGETLDPQPAMDMYPRRPMRMRVLARRQA